MKWIALLTALVAALGPPLAAQSTRYVTPDVATDDPGGSGTIYMPWDVVGYSAGLYSPAPVVSFPPNTPVDALHKMDRPGHWLLSVEAPTELPPGGGVIFEPEDVILFDGFNFVTFFDGTSAGVPPGVNVDAAFLARDDLGDLVISFDVPTSIGAVTYEPSDLVRYAGGVFSLFFDASAAGTGVALSGNVTGADAAPGLSIFALDIPTDLAPSTGPVTYIPGDIADWDGAGFNLFDSLAGWPLSSEVDGFSCQANPGRVYDRVVYALPIKMNKSLLSPGNVVLYWAPSCSSGAEDYGIYEGTLGTWYSHRKILCVDVGADFQEDFTPQAVDSYYLVVPHNWADEGAYGVDFDPTRVPSRIERPQAALPADRCTLTQVVTPCP